MRTPVQRQGGRKKTMLQIGAEKRTRKTLDFKHRNQI